MKPAPLMLLARIACKPGMVSNHGVPMRPAAKCWYREDCFLFEESLRSKFFKRKTKSWFEKARETGDSMRRVLVSMALLACAVPASAQNSVGNVPGQSPLTMNRNRQAGRHPASAAKESTPPVDLPPDTPVVTLNGVCEPAPHAENQDCKTVVAREQMDKIVALMAQGNPKVSHRQMAIDYVRMLAASKLANDRKLGNNPAVAVELEKQGPLGRLRVLSSAFYRQLEEDAGNPTTTEIQQYYDDHRSAFEEGEVLRLSIPYSVVSSGGMRIDRRILKAEVDSLRSRAAAGYDFDQLQVLAYKDLGINAVPPPTKLAMARRSSMSPDQEGVFNLQPGEVTPVIESYTHMVVLKLASKRTAPLESVLPEIKEDLRRERLQQEIQKASKSVTAEFNLHYLGLSAQPALFAVPENAHPYVQAGIQPDARQGTVSRRRLPATPAATTAQPQTQSHP
jgi:hypothetical protein